LNGKADGYYWIEKGYGSYVTEGTKSAQAQIDIARDSADYVIIVNKTHILDNAII
jgi:hypothetical protein